MQAVDSSKLKSNLWVLIQYSGLKVLRQRAGSPVSGVRQKKKKKKIVIKKKSVDIKFEFTYL